MKGKLSVIVPVGLLTILTAAEAWAGYCVIRLQMLPPVLVGVLICALVLIAAGLTVMLFAHGRDKKISLARKIVAYVLLALLVAGCLIAVKAANEFYYTMNQITKPDDVGPVRNVYVLVDDPAQTIQDAAEYTFGIVSGYDENCTQQVVTALESELEITLKSKTYDSVPALIEGLYGKQVEAIIFNDGYLSILEDETQLDAFAEKTRVLYSVPVEEDGSSEEIVNQIPDITNTPFIMYLSGSDTRSYKLSVSRSDVNILMVVNPVTKQILMVNTPRDYYVVHPYGSGARDKLTHCGIYGVECSVEALEKLYEIDVSCYAQINFTGFEKLIDAIGGVTIYSDRAFTTVEQTFVQVGENQMNGKEALGFARDRYHQANGDNDRGKNQMKVIQAVIDKITSGATLISGYSDILKSMEGMFVTSVSMDDISKLVRMQLSDMAQWEIHSFAVTGFGDTQRTYSMPGTGAYVMHPDEKSVAYASELMQKVLDGEILQDSDMQMPK